MKELDQKQYDQIIKKTHNSQMTLYALAAERLDIEWEMIIRALLIEFRKDDKVWRIHKSLTPINNAVATAIASYKTTCNTFLDKRGFPVPKQSSAKKPKDIIEFQKENDIENIVVKPRRGVGGYGVTILPETQKDITNAFQKAEEHCLSDKKTKVAVEEFIPGENYRILVLDDQVIAAAHRVAPFVTGDGKLSIDQLVKAKNKKLQNHNRPKIKIDKETEIALQNQDLEMTSIPRENQKVKLRFNANMSTGGSTRECLQEVHPEYKAIAIEVVQNVGLKLAGLDLITTDITQPTSNYGINEINHNPGLRIHYMPDEGQIADVALKIQKYILNNL